MRCFVVHFVSNFVLCDCMCYILIDLALFLFGLIVFFLFMVCVDCVTCIFDSNLCVCFGYWIASTCWLLMIIVVVLSIWFVCDVVFVVLLCCLCVVCVCECLKQYMLLRCVFVVIWLYLCLLTCVGPVCFVCVFAFCHISMYIYYVWYVVCLNGGVVCVALVVFPLFMLFV